MDSIQDIQLQLEEIVRMINNLKHDDSDLNRINLCKKLDKIILKLYPKNNSKTINNDVNYII